MGVGGSWGKEREDFPSPSSPILARGGGANLPQTSPRYGKIIKNAANFRPTPEGRLLNNQKFSGFCQKKL